MGKNIRAGLCLLIVGLCVDRPAVAQSDYYRHVIFDNSQQLQLYWQSGATSTEPSYLESANYRLPVESTVFRTPPNALRIDGNQRLAALGTRRSISSTFRIAILNCPAVLFISGCIHRSRSRPPICLA